MGYGGLNMKKLVISTILIFLTFYVLGCSSGLYSGSPKRGTVSDGVYTNDYFKLSFTIPEEWTAYTDEEIYERTGASRATNEDLATSKMGFGDVNFYKTIEQEDQIKISYRISLEKGLTDDQIQNRLSVQNSDVTFGEVESVKIGDVDYVMMSGPSSDGTVNYYYVWSKEVCGYLRPVIYMQLTDNKSVYDLLKNFSQITD